VKSTGNDRRQQIGADFARIRGDAVQPTWSSRSVEISTTYFFLLNCFIGDEVAGEWNLALVQKQNKVPERNIERTSTDSEESGVFCVVQALGLLNAARICLICEF
jgi:hypothetical protein